MMRGFRFAGTGSIFCILFGAQDAAEVAKPTLSLNLSLTALVKDLCSQKFVVSETYLQIYLLKEGVHLVRIIYCFIVIIYCLKSLAAPMASHQSTPWTKPYILITSVANNTTVLAFRYVRFSSFNFCCFILQLWAYFPRPSRRPDRFKVQEGGLQGVHKWQFHTAQSEVRGGRTLGNPG